MVGKRGFEPLSFSLSGSCSDLLSYMPADGGGPDPQRSRAQPGSSRRLPPGSFTIHVRRAENSNPSALAPGRFRGGARALAGSLSKAEDGDPDSQRLPAPNRFPAGAGSLPGSSSMAEGGLLESHSFLRIR